MAPRKTKGVPGETARSSGESFEEVSLHRTTYKFPVRKIRVESLRLNPYNPRFGHYVDLYGKPMTQEQMIDEIWEDPRTKDLYNSVKVHGIQEKLWRHN